MYESELVEIPPALDQPNEWVLISLTLSVKVKECSSALDKKAVFETSPTFFACSRAEQHETASIVIACLCRGHVELPGSY